MTKTYISSTDKQGRTVIREGRKTVATITSKTAGGYQLYVPLCRTSGIGADYATMDEAINGAAMILDKPWASAVIVARPR